MPGLGQGRQGVGDLRTRALLRLAPRVVLLDCNMPIATGEKFLPILQSLNPDVRVIVVSGMLKDYIEEKFKGLGYFASFQKGGLSVEALRKKIDEALA